MAETLNTNPGGISRRTVAKGVAWAVPRRPRGRHRPPRTPPPPQLSGIIGSACKYPPGNSTANCDKSFRIGSTWTNSGTTTLTVTFSAVVESVNLTQVGVVIDGVVYPPANTNRPCRSLPAPTPSRCTAATPTVATAAVR